MLQRILDFIINKFNDFFNSDYEQGIYKVKCGDYKGAIADFNKCIDRNPKDSKTYYMRGVAKHEMGDYEGALEDCNNDFLLNSFESIYEREFQYNLRGKLNMVSRIIQVL
jgi:tetratricopeptide (TPR) repeat protein